MLPSQDELILLQKKMTELKGQSFLPAELLDLLGEVYTLQLKARGNGSATPPPVENISDEERRAQGAPLLERCEFPYRLDAVEGLFRKLLNLAKEAENPLGAAAKLVETALDEGELDLAKAVDAYINEDAGLFLEWEKRTPEAPRTLAFLTQSALMPSLAQVAQSLAEHLDPKRAWPFGHCPVCGSLPLIGSLREKEGYRHLTCSFCQTEYRASRLGCPLCDEHDHEKLTFFKAEGEPGFRLDVCNTCKGYIKIADFRQLDRKHLPLLDDFASLPLDILAKNKGYGRATLSAWGF